MPWQGKGSLPGQSGKRSDWVRTTMTFMPSDVKDNIMKDNVAILEIDGREILFSSAEKASAAMNLIDGVLSSTGYGKDRTWEIKEVADVSMQLVSSSRVLKLEDEDQAAKLIERAKDAAEKSSNETSKVKSELKREQLFWKLRNSAHAKGVDDETLREQLSRVEWWNADSFEVKA